jgi:lysophospholipase L1-like esterase
MFDPPVVQGGQTPVNVSCAPSSGTTFQFGATPVTCTATDSLNRSGSCSFSVTVAPAPVLTVTQIAAFGDSITEGVTSPAPMVLLLNLPDSYPMKLQPLVSARYIDQAVTVANEGKAGEPAVGDGVARFRDVVSRTRPEAVLLLHGANDLLARQERAISGIVGALEDMVKYGKARGVRMLLANFPPQNPNGTRGAGARAVPELNRQIAAVAADEQVPLVDLYGKLNGDPNGVVGIDGLHPTPQGYEKIAAIWFEAIKQHLERPNPLGPPTPLNRIPTP